MVLFPLSAFRAISIIEQEVCISIAKERTQKDLLDIMQSLEELYDRLNYHSFEQKLDELYKYIKKNKEDY
jgi:methylisocitrate lyase